MVHSGEPRNSFKMLENALRKAQQAMSRKVKFSNNWNKEKAKVQRVHAKSVNSRRDYLHKTSSDISKTTRWCVLRICRCGTCPSQRRAASRSRVKREGQIWPEQVHPRPGLGRIRRQLDYKLAWNGGHLIAVPLKTPAGRVRAVVTYRRITAPRKLGLPVWNVALKKTPMSSARSMY